MQIASHHPNLQTIMATKVVIAARPVKTSDRIDRDGNIINPATKQVIIPKEADYIPPVAQPIAETPQPISPPTAQPAPINQTSPMDIVSQIQQAKDNLKKLDELRKLKIKELKKQAELLELEK